MPPPSPTKRLYTSDPYQWFFPLGILFGLTGTGFWILFGFGRLPFYPSPHHAEAMIGGFLLTVAIGFLMTAIPRFTGTPSASTGEKGVIFLTAIALFCASFFSFRFWFHGLVAIELLLLFRFGLSRIIKAAFRPAPSFPLVGFGLLMALIGTFLLLANDVKSLPSAAVFFARLIFWYGLFNGLALGIGTQLLPSIMGIVQTASSPSLPTPLNAGDRNRNKRRFFILCGFILFASFAVEAGLSLFWGRLLRALLVTTVMIGYWKIYRFPRSPGILTLCLWISGCLLLIGQWPGVFFPQYAVHGAHILFIASLSLMIFSVATRVTLSHGGHDLALERRSPALVATLLFLFAALIVRLLAPFNEGYFRLLVLASVLWIGGALSWSVFFLPKIFNRRHP
ncbi:MAG: NnrS family protein [Deltaproteobacteria bacterium]|nr:NnrS family protein [Deltaproteobacteria bacterium]